MSGRADRAAALLPELQRWAGELTSALQARALAADRTLLFGALGALIGVACVLGLFLLVRRLMKVQLRVPGASRSARVAALAARGVSPAEIARRTRLSRDAVGMLLQARPASRDRRILPLTARIAAPAALRRPMAAGGRNRQVLAMQGHTRRGHDRSGPAHRLLDALSRSLRTSRQQRVA